MEALRRRRLVLITSGSTGPGLPRARLRAGSRGATPAPPRRRRRHRGATPRGARSGAAHTTWGVIRRVHLGTREPANWVQLFKFGVVGATGYVVNLVVFAALVEGLGVHHIPGAVGAFCVAVTNNFLLNRHWTFDAPGGHAGEQAWRFFAVASSASGSTSSRWRSSSTCSGARARRPGARRRDRDAGELHRQQALDVRALGPAGRLGRGAAQQAYSSAPMSRRRAPSQLPPSGPSSARRSPSMSLACLGGASGLPLSISGEAAVRW